MTRTGSSAPDGVAKPFRAVGGNQRPPAHISAANLLLPIHIRKGNLEMRLFSTIMTLGTPQDVTLQELRIETLFPADEASERTWRNLAPAD